MNGLKEYEKNKNKIVKNSYFTAVVCGYSLNAEHIIIAIISGESGYDLSNKSYCKIITHKNNKLGYSFWHGNFGSIKSKLIKISIR